MSDRPILFNAEMVRATLDRRKTQARRPIKPQPPAKIYKDGQGLWYPPGPWAGRDWRCPFGGPGGLLWVREAWTAPAYEDWKPSEMPQDIHIRYRATDKNANDKRYTYSWRPSIHMPRWASRLTLRIKREWVERVQDITEEDAIAEGLRSFTYNYTGSGKSNPRRVYQAFPDKDGGFSRATQALEALWNSIYAAKGLGWDTNPYVWACEFEKENHEQNGN